MSPPPNDSTKFEVAWLIFWVLLSTVLIVLAVLRKLTLPNIIKGDKIFSMIFAFLQLVIFVLLLALLAHDQWSIYKVSSNFGNFWLAYGVTSAKNNNGDSREYSCSDSANSEIKTYCQTIQTAGAFTLIFGLVAIFTAAILLVLVLVSLAGKEMLARFNRHIPMLSNVQWIAMQAMVIIWGVCGHDGLHQANKDVKLGDSWAIAFCNTIFAIVAALFFAGGAGQTATGATSAGPADQPAVQPAQ